MAPVPFKHPLRYTPVTLAAGHLWSICYFTYAVADSLYTSYELSGPVSNTRSRIARRRRLAPAFLGLAVASFLVAAHYSFTSATLSYKTWAYEHGLDLAQRIFGEGKVAEYATDANGSSGFQLGQWLSDTPIYHDTLEIVAEKTRRFWWGQQIDLATTAFSLMLATEGRRRNIPLRTAFLALAHLVNLSFAQNLFFLALLLTPSPLASGGEKENLKLPIAPGTISAWTRFRDALFPPKPAGWVPAVGFFYATIGLNLGLTFLLPYAAGTPSFVTTALLARASSFLLLALPRIVPERWGRIRQHPHDGYEQLTKLFRFLSMSAFVLHVKTSLVALVSNAPDSHYHRHSALLPWDSEERSRWERGTSAVEKVLGSTSDHPVVAAVGWDVLLCALSLGLWAAVRGINARNMISSSIPGTSSLLDTTSISNKLKQATDKGRSALQELKPQLVDKSHKREHEHEHELEQEEDHEQRVTRRRGRSGRGRAGSLASSPGASEDTTAVPQSPTTPSKRGRGRPRKAKQTPHQDDNNTDNELVVTTRPTARRGKDSKTRHQDHRRDEGDDDEDGPYVPTPAAARSALALEGDELPPNEEINGESAALAWTLAALGGLPAAGAAVFGGECVSR
ncbi:hypothetical protein F5Y17DRAFT_437404 [Xylariaceae sp. FL0594]|nr:hypothetical protein F5Y17DRAFT_437404 [Xylariaceae sp. FL0594]